MTREVASSGMAIPDGILNKPPPLGAAPSLAHIADPIRSHHEHYDGGGYPDGQADEEIPLSASIIAFCAAFVAMMRHRPYSDATTVAEAPAELRRWAGSASRHSLLRPVLRAVASGAMP
jgi:HD-GYP domain-containing protein (c-di-GMP phosphodiesterase class II)